jgi:hypothetical protein
MTNSPPMAKPQPRSLLANDNVPAPLARLLRTA